MLRKANYVYGKGVITEDTETGKYGFIGDTGETLIPFNYDFATVWNMVQSGSLKPIPTTEEIIQASNEGQEIDEYKVSVVEIVLKALGIQRYQPHRFNSGLRDSKYSKVVSAIYTIIGEILEKGDVTFMMYDYGYRNEEYEAFRKRLSDLTGISIEYFTSALEKRIAEEKYFEDIGGRSPAKFLVKKPKLYIGIDYSYYQSDIAEKDSYSITVERKTKKVNK